MLSEVITFGLTAGSIYALAALGYTLIYGVLGFVNFAHGEFMMTGAFVAYTVSALLGMPLPASFLCAFLVTGMLGLLVERTAYRPLYDSIRMAPVISSLGVSIVLRAFFQLSFGPGQRSLTETDSIPRMIKLLGLLMPWHRLLMLVAALLLMILLFLWVSRTMTGKTIQAISQSRILAQAVGVDFYRTTRMVFFVASAVGGFTGALVAIDQNLDPNMGVILGFKGFTASIIGGIGSISGALLGGIILGLCENLVGGYISTSAKDAVTFVFLGLILLFRPKGLFGTELRRD